MLNHYETVFIATPVLSENQMKEAVQKFKKVITDNSGKIVHEENWGLKKLAYPIQKKSTGFYYLLEFKGPGELVEKLEVQYRRDERIIRFLTFKMGKFAVEYAEKKRKQTIPISVNIKEMEKSKLDIISRLYLLREVFENLITNYKDYLKEGEKEETFLSEQKRQIDLIDKKIEELRNGDFQFSIEELYSMFGRYDKFISIDFHPISESGKRFGKTIMGTLIYNRRERQDFNKIFESGNIPRTNGNVRINPSPLCKLSEEQVNNLKLTGFKSGDIFEINNTAIDYRDSYLDKRTKEIPGTINIKFDPSDFNHELMGLYLLERRVTEKNKPLIEAEWDELYALKILYKISDITNAEWNENIYEKSTNTIKESIRYRILHSKLMRGIALAKEESNDLSQLIKKRYELRSKLVDNEIKRSSNKKLNELLEENKELIQELKRNAYFFETENLSPFGAKHPVFLEIERYLHIFIRHFKDFQIGNWKGGRTPFLYNFKDTKRLIKIVIEQLQSRSDKAIDEGRDFIISDKNAFFFNGNYYVVHIDKSGRLLSFYPHSE
jgi:ribosomal protein S6